MTRRDSPALYDTLDALYLSPSDAFRELAPTYDQRLAGNPLLALESSALLAALPDIRGKAVADIGCGTGRYTIQLARLGAESVQGIDLCTDMIDIARRKARRTGDLEEIITWRRGDLLETLPIADASMDLIVCSLTLSFLPEIEGALALMATALTKGGILVIGDYHPHGLTQARAEATMRNGNKEKAPFLRFTSASGDDCRVAQYIHPISQLWDASRSAELALEHLLEPIADRQTTNTYAGLREQSGVPLAIVATFRKAG